MLPRCNSAQKLLSNLLNFGYKPDENNDKNIQPLTQ